MVQPLPLTFNEEMEEFSPFGINSLPILHDVVAEDLNPVVTWASLHTHRKLLLLSERFPKYPTPAPRLDAHADTQRRRGWGKS